MDGMLTNKVPSRSRASRTRPMAISAPSRSSRTSTSRVETRVPKGGNSGVYLRGIYEVQVLDSYGKPLDPHNMGAIYSRICPTVAAEKPAGQWQTLDITLVDRHVTVILNGTKIIDNQPHLGLHRRRLVVRPVPPRPDLSPGRSHRHRVSQRRHPAGGEKVGGGFDARRRGDACAENVARNPNDEVRACGAAHTRASSFFRDLHFDIRHLSAPVFRRVSVGTRS